MSLLLAAAAQQSAPVPPPPSSAPYNAASHLITPTYDGSGNTVHPDVIDFTLHGLPDWNGYRYWMGHTPYPGSRDALENPSILASNDGLTWVEPDGITNPIHPQPPYSYNSDPDLVYDADTDELVYLFRTDGGTGRHVLLRSADGVTWPTTPTNLSGETIIGVSPAVVQLADGTWAMWGIRGNPPRLLQKRTAPTIEGPWSAPEECSGHGPNAWHLDVTRIGSTLYALISDGRESEPAIHGIYAASSTDGITWNRNPTVMIRRGTTGAWDRGGLYRPTLQAHDNGNAMRVWYSALTVRGADVPPPQSWHIGYTEIPLHEWP